MLKKSNRPSSRFFTIRRCSCRWTVLRGYGERYNRRGGAVPESGGDRKRELPPVPARDGDADAVERRGPQMDTGDARASQRGEHADLYAGQHPCAAGGACQHASGGALGRRET